MTGPREDEFEGIEINGPWGGVRLGGAGGAGGFAEGDGDAEYRRVRRRVRQRLELYRHMATYALVVGPLFLLDWATGGDFWVQWLAVIWGAIIALQFFGTFISPMLWGRDVEERMVRRELERRRGSVSVTTRPDDDMVR